MSDAISSRQSYEAGGWNDGRIGQAYDLLCKVLTERDPALYRHPLLGEVEALDHHKCARCDAPAITELDGDNLCQSHADAWCRSEGHEARRSA